METSLISRPEALSTDEVLLEVNSASFRYSARGPWLFKGLSLTVSAGEILSILGPNARGKTTLLKCLAGLLKPVAGQVSAHADIGYVPQDHGSGAAFLVRDMVLMGRTRMLRPFQVPRAEDREAATAAMLRVGVEDWADREYSQLSGGQRQLVLIARAVASGSRILILDEPASALDLRNQAKILAVLGQLAEDGFAVVMTTHHPDHALHISRNALLFVGSHDTRWGPVEEMLSASALSEVYGLPICLPRVLTDSGSRHVAVPDFGQGCRVNRITPVTIETSKENL
ncbi:ABC transporter ATP-binding protein [Arthrobacter psychrolactophilus]|uniref:ABC transporter ATP-binding protein n=1 Tax=Arthrobacter psychrolactophilus TaxID=92442 RepID=A0A2V5IUK9_9MICC|nr:ABC transporter ATP-binding protein [Arthrobacter psychrolactophilus]PYI40205.1 ABC transporter ATP-binding protein [Arthrobacter psychrolactophilus]